MNNQLIGRGGCGSNHSAPPNQAMLGEQIIKGMAVTARNFFGSYVSKERLTTVQYPEERLAQKGNTRQFPMLVFDDDPEKGLRCVACTDLREGMSAAVHLHRQEQGQEARLQRPAAILSGDVRH